MVAPMVVMVGEVGTFVVETFMGSRIVTEERCHY